MFVFLFPFSNLRIQQYEQLLLLLPKNKKSVTQKWGKALHTNAVEIEGVAINLFILV